MYYILYTTPNKNMSMSMSMSINPRWPPVLVSAQSWRSYEKIRDCEESRDVKSSVFGVGGRKSPI